MHEWSLALSVVESVDKWAKANSLNVRKIVLSVPPVAQLDISILKEAFDFLKKESNLQQAELEVKLRGVRYRCRACGYEFTDAQISQVIKNLSDYYGEEYPLHLIPELLPTFVKCPRCGSHDIEADLSIRIEEVETL